MRGQTSRGQGPSLGWQGQNSQKSMCGLMLAGSLVLLSGCSWFQGPLFELQDEHYQPMLERQMAGLPFDDSVSKTEVKEFTAEEYEQIGDDHIKQGKVVLAAVQYEASLKLAPSSISARYKAGQVYLQHGKAEKAYERFHDILNYDFEYALAYEGMGRALLRMSKEDEAKLEFEQALVFDPTLWSVHNFLGIVADRQSQHHAAVKYYRNALDIRPNEPHVLNNLGMAHFLNKDYGQAVNVFQQAIYAGSKNPKVFNNLGLTYAKLEKYSESYNAFQRGLDAPKAYNNLGLLFLEANQTARAIKCFENAVDSQTTFYEKAQENLTLAKQELSKLPSFRRRATQFQQGQCL